MSSYARSGLETCHLGQFNSPCLPSDLAPLRGQNEQARLTLMNTNKIICSIILVIYLLAKTDHALKWHLSIRYNMLMRYLARLFLEV